MKPYYDDGNGIVIYHGDCREVLPTLERSNADLVFADPPFSVPVKYHDAEGEYPRGWGDLVVMEPYFVEIFREIRRVSKEGSQVYICCDGDSYPVFYKAALPIWPQSHLLIWYKPTGRRGRGWMHAHELILHLRTPRTEYAPQTEMRQDVVGIMPVRTLNRQHPAQKPGDLIDFIADALPVGDSLLLDTHMGSGTTLCTAKTRGLRAIGIEIEERYCEIAARRLSQEVLPLGGAA